MSSADGRPAFHCVARWSSAYRRGMPDEAGTPTPGGSGPRRSSASGASAHGARTADAFAGVRVSLVLSLAPSQSGNVRRRTSPWRSRRAHTRTSIVNAVTTATASPRAAGRIAAGIGFSILCPMWGRAGWRAAGGRRPGSAASAALIVRHGRPSPALICAHAPSSRIAHVHAAGSVWPAATNGFVGCIKSACCPSRILNICPLYSIIRASTPAEAACLGEMTPPRGRASC